MPKITDCRPVAAELYVLPVTLRVPLKFGATTTTRIHCARVRLTVEDRAGRRAVGWGETPLAAAWAWPSDTPYDARVSAMEAFCRRVAELWPTLSEYGHPLELGYDIQREHLPGLLASVPDAPEPIPLLAGLVALSAFDLALHDAFGVLHGVDTYATYGPDFVNRDLAAFIEPAADGPKSFAGRFPSEFLVLPGPKRLAAWHLVGGLDPLDESELKGTEPNDGYPVTLVDWIARDGLTCLKIKLRGNDSAWDYARSVAVGKIARERGATDLTADFNCTVTDPAYVNEILDRLAADERPIFDAIRYVEQPFPYDLEANPIDVHSVSGRKPLFLDESAHDWRCVQRGRELGWTGVALKTCKTQTGALLSLCWAKAHGMPLMVQDLTNPMLAQIPHVRLAAHAGTIGGVETNGMQFYPEASAPEAAVHPGLYRRKEGIVDLSTLAGPGFGYRLDEMRRELPSAACKFPA